MARQAQFIVRNFGYHCVNEGPIVDTLSGKRALAEIEEKVETRTHEQQGLA